MTETCCPQGSSIPPGVSVSIHNKDKVHITCTIYASNSVESFYYIICTLYVHITHCNTADTIMYILTNMLDVH